MEDVIRCGSLLSLPALESVLSCIFHFHVQLGCCLFRWARADHRVWFIFQNPRSGRKHVNFVQWHLRDQSPQGTSPIFPNLANTEDKEKLQTIEWILDWQDSLLQLPPSSELVVLCLYAKEELPGTHWSLLWNIATEGGSHLTKLSFTFFPHKICF